jgi:transposase
VVNQAIDTGCKAIGVEDIHLDNMTRRCKAKRDNEGSYLPNGQAAKSGLSRSLLGRSLGQIKTFVEYRCRRIGLLFIPVGPADTSSECPECHHEDKRNRLSQSDFECVRCHHAEHADVAGGTNVRDRAFGEDYRDIAGNFFKKCSPFKSEKRSTRGACMSRGIPQKPAVHGGSIIL